MIVQGKGRDGKRLENVGFNREIFNAPRSIVLGSSQRQVNQVVQVSQVSKCPILQLTLVMGTVRMTLKR